MKTEDPLSQHLHQWQPESPYQKEVFVADTMRFIRRTNRESISQKIVRRGSEFLDGWLPTPGVLVPVIIFLIFSVGIFQWTKTTKIAMDVASLQWNEELSRPLAQVSFAGVYLQINKE